ncbi:Short integuments 2, mitochondrial [Clydaea vesicula]|uniref:Short integuments 2, mitochondrial n=1 Tax=Clydaea vesicula TaxID=447962 RepID=A0AAD5U376_9FUNG|nr:Short integuments 2, mitochondrial [Clydaea vesicula]
MHNANSLAQQLASASLAEVEDEKLSDGRIIQQQKLKPNLDTIKKLLLDGNGEILLDVGVDDDGNSLNLSDEDFEHYMNELTNIAHELESEATLLKKRSNIKFRNQGNNSTKENELKTTDRDCYNYGHVLIRKRCGKIEDLLEIRVAVVGNVDAGKSTMLGVLTKDLLDDGRGKARVNLFKHKHEMETGRTSSVGSEIMGFNAKGCIITPTYLVKTKVTWEDVCSNSSKVLSFIDLAGHEKYLRTTCFGMTGHSPDFVMLMIGANAGIIGMTKEHLGLALALNVPVFIVITKIDMCPKNILEATITQLTKVLRSSGCRKIPIFVNNDEDVLVATSSFVSERICPIFQISNLTGENLPLLKLFLNLLPSNYNLKYATNKPVEYQITDTFSVPGDSFLLGPDTQGQFIPTIVKSIQRKRINVPCASAGQTATFALKKTKRSAIRKGMVLVSKSIQPTASYEFDAEILILYHSSTINKRYQTMLHCGTIRQAARIVSMDRDLLRTGDRAIVRFRFLQYPEYLKPGTRLLFREGRTKGIGKVVKGYTLKEEISGNHQNNLIQKTLHANDGNNDGNTAEFDKANLQINDIFTDVNSKKTRKKK